MPFPVSNLDRIWTRSNFRMPEVRFVVISLGRGDAAIFGRALC
ncbi:hypothetical protein Y038_6003 [Burkholderia pseudomallei MSHR543]|nr:hypothetical protein Y038_6003 [Burkholderia pseudomallei MSHR543]